jgi:hypothetical protein
MRSRPWVVFALALVVTLAGARCAKDVPLGIAPASDAATDAADAGAPD